MVIYCIGCIYVVGNQFIVCSMCQLSIKMCCTVGETETEKYSEIQSDVRQLWCGTADIIYRLLCAEKCEIVQHFLHSWLHLCECISLVSFLLLLCNEPDRINRTGTIKINLRYKNDFDVHSMRKQITDTNGHNRFCNPSQYVRWEFQKVHTIYLLLTCSLIHSGVMSTHTHTHWGIKIETSVFFYRDLIQPLNQLIDHTQCAQSEEWKVDYSIDLWHQ